jgi:hypothetical protein
MSPRRPQITMGSTRSRRCGERACRHGFDATAKNAFDHRAGVRAGNPVACASYGFGAARAVPAPQPMASEHGRIHVAHWGNIPFIQQAMTGTAPHETAPCRHGNATVVCEDPHPPATAPSAVARPGALVG